QFSSSPFSIELLWFRLLTFPLSVARHRFVLDSVPTWQIARAGHTIAKRYEDMDAVSAVCRILIRLGLILLIWKEYRLSVTGAVQSQCCVERGHTERHQSVYHSAGNSSIVPSSIHNECLSFDIQARVAKPMRLLLTSQAL